MRGGGEHLLCLHHGKGLPGSRLQEQLLWNKDSAVALLHTSENYTAVVYKRQEFISLPSTNSREGNLGIPLPVVKVSGSQTPSACSIQVQASLLKVTFQGQGASETSRWSEQETG